MKTLALYVLGLAASVALFAQPSAPSEATITESGAFLTTAKNHAAAALARSDLSAYRGWIKFLVFEADAEAARHGVASDSAQTKARRLDDWIQRVNADPALITKMRGVQEWAYESPVDGSGQPFKFVIPTDYDPARPTPLSLYMHGYSGNHLEHSTGMSDHPGAFEVAVLGRARGGWYSGLSRADVLQALDYIAAHWNIDNDRIHLSGGSMGGGATFKLGSRYPHRFASGQITCGYVEQEPIANLLTFPIYATHSEDDPVVPIITSRGPLTLLRQLGGQAVFDETTGFGHQVWNYVEGNQRSGAWAVQQVRPASTSVRHLDFTALDADAMRAWWAEIVEWGPEPKPAHFILTAGANNTLFAELTNIDRLRLRLVEAPFDHTLPLHLVINGRLPIELPAPLPPSLILTRVSESWNIETAPIKTPFRLHTPGGPLQVYNGEPLLIVYGTHGSEAARSAMHNAADAASKSPNPGWAPEGGEAGVDGVPHRHNLYGNLQTKADVDVTDSDLQRCHLVLIGSAEENSVVAKIAAKLPVQFSGGEITCSDGLALSGTHQTLGLFHYNPLAPQRLIFWVASADPAGYAASATVPELTCNYFVGADLLVSDATAGTLTLTRSFDSRWSWVPGRERSPLVPATLGTNQSLGFAIAESVRRATGADFAIAGHVSPLGSTALTDGVTRVCDLEPLFYHNPVDLIEISGAELLADNAKFIALAADATDWAQFQPAVDPAKIDPTHRYQVAIPMKQFFDFGHCSHTSPRTQRRSAVQVADSLARFLATP